MCAPGLRFTARVALGLASALALATCASGPPVPPCDEGALRPAPAAACLDDPASRRFLLDTGHRLGDALMSWRSRPGRVRLALGFGPDASVESVCLRDRSGPLPASRIRRAAVGLGRASAPACFANRRIEFDWQSPLVTAWEIRRAERACARAADPPVRAIEACHWIQNCQVAEIERLAREADDRVARCVLQRVPISVASDDRADPTFFLPDAGRSHDARHALDSLSACDGQPRRVDAIGCMARRGWRPVEPEVVRAR